MPDSESHDWLDAELRNVPLPNNLLARLSQAGPRLAPSDERLDAALRAVDVPIDLESRLRRIARPRYRPTPTWQRLALAASVFVIVGLGVSGYVALIGGALESGPKQIAGTSATPAPVTKSANARLSEGPAAKSTTPVAKVDDPAAPLAIAKPDAKPRGPAPAIEAASDKSHPTDDDSADPGPAIERVAESGSTTASANTDRSEQAALGASGALDRIPDLESVDSLVSRRGIAPPRVSGYDLLFQLKHGEHPFVSPAAHADLASTRVPFTFSTLGYDLARQAVASGQAPATDDIRVEDFLSAQHYLLPPPPSGGLALHMAGTPSPNGKKGLHLMHVMVQSASRYARPHAPTRLIVAVEMSWQMRTGGRWEAARRALVDLAGHLGDADRITLVGFADQARVFLQDATGRELSELLAGDEFNLPGGTADYVEGIEATIEATRAGRGTKRSRAVFLVANRKRFGQAMAASKQALAELDSLETPWQSLCIAPASLDETRDEPSVTRTKSTAPKSTPPTSIVTVATTRAIDDVLGEALTDRPSTVASDATLRIAFNPKVVTSYRLLGHEAMTLTGGASDPVVIDLSADSSSGGLFELWLKPGNDEVVATAELDWRDPQSRKAGRISRPLRRSQMGASFSQAPPWFQQAVVAAKAAEAMRGSFYADSPRPVGQVLELVDRVDPRVAREGTFQDLVNTVRQAEKLR